MKWLSCLLSPIPSQIVHTLFNINSCGVDAILYHDQDTCKTVHTSARSKMPQHNIMNIVYIYFPKTGMCIDQRQLPQLCPYHIDVAKLCEWYNVLQISLDTLNIPLRGRLNLPYTMHSAYIWTGVVCLVPLYGRIGPTYSV